MIERSQVEPFVGLNIEINHGCVVGDCPDVDTVGKLVTLADSRAGDWLIVQKDDGGRTAVQLRTVNSISLLTPSS